MYAPNLICGRLLTALLVEFDPGCEAMIYSTNGTPLQGEILALGH